ncbi:Putative D-mannonate oxidoreductase [Cronobacter universalis NCTC 9529]|nr:Putative D-mannonate oxidoreductase [Cronobacter universalis NCTC 9529]
MRYVSGVDEQGDAIEVCDPLLNVIQTAVRASEEGDARVKALLNIREIFGEDLATRTEFVAQVTEAYKLLCENGARATVARYVKAGC